MASIDSGSEASNNEAYTDIKYNSSISKSNSNSKHQADNSGHSQLSLNVDFIESQPQSQVGSPESSLSMSISTLKSGIRSLIFFDDGDVDQTEARRKIERKLYKKTKNQ